MSGRVAPWVYRAGVYSSGAMNREFGEFNGGVFTLALLGYDFGPDLGMREALVTGNYLYQQEDPNNTFTRQLRHIVSIHTRFEDARWGPAHGRVEGHRLPRTAGPLEPSWRCRSST